MPIPAAGFFQCLTQQHVAFLGPLSGHQHVRFLEVGGADGIALDEHLDGYGLRRLRGRGAQFLFRNDHVIAFLVFEGFNDVLPGDFLAGVGVDALVANRLAVTTVKHAKMQIDRALSRINLNRNVQETK